MKWLCWRSWWWWWRNCVMMKLWWWGNVSVWWSRRSMSPTIGVMSILCTAYEWKIPLTHHVPSVFVFVFVFLVYLSLYLYLHCWFSAQLMNEISHFHSSLSTHHFFCLIIYLIVLCLKGQFINVSTWTQLCRSLWREPGVLETYNQSL